MRYGVLGTGMVGVTIATKLIDLGHEVSMGSRSPDSGKAREWAEQSGANASAGSFNDVCSTAEQVFNCLPGIHCVDVMAQVPHDALASKVLIDVANALDFSHGFPPSLAVASTDSVAEQIQRAQPDAFVVKSLNTVNAEVMVNPSRLVGEHHIFVAGDSADAKNQVKHVLREFGWPADSVIDLGGLPAARGLEMYLPLWLSLMGHVGSPDFNIRVVSGQPTG